VADLTSELARTLFETDIRAMEHLFGHVRGLNIATLFGEADVILRIVDSLKH